MQASGGTNEVVWYHSNTLHSVYALSDASESVAERYKFDAYGAATVLEPDGASDPDGLSDVENPYLFTARRAELESGLMQYRYREYDKTAGRFISRDPLPYWHSWNLYDYVGARPTRWVDSLGLVPEDIADATGAVIENAPDVYEGVKDACTLGKGALKVPKSLQNTPEGHQAAQENAQAALGFIAENAAEAAAEAVGNSAAGPLGKAAAWYMNDAGPAMLEAGKAQVARYAPCVDCASTRGGRGYGEFWRPDCMDVVKVPIRFAEDPEFRPMCRLGGPDGKGVVYASKMEKTSKYGTAVEWVRCW